MNKIMIKINSFLARQTVGAKIAINNSCGEGYIDTAVKILIAVVLGALLMLTITGSTLNLQSYMGIIMSVGVSIANAVLLVTNRSSNLVLVLWATMAMMVTNINRKTTYNPYAKKQSKIILKNKLI